MNGKLADYLPLWERLDRLIVMHPSDYRCSVQWRTEAEQKMIAAGKAGMTNSEIEQFVKYFWQALHPELFIQPLVKSSQWVDLVIEINSDRSIGKVYRPSEI
jgi:D-glycerate 3-kinase